MKLVNAISLLAAMAAFPALAQQDAPASFQEVDKNTDGVLNIEEAHEALPGVEISDANADGVVSKSEAENSIAGLELTSDGQGDGAAPVGEPEYRMIVQVLERNAQASN